MSNPPGTDDQARRIRAAARKDGDHSYEHTRAQLDVELKRERKTILREFQELASGLELANADYSDQPAEDFCRGVRSAGRRLSKLIAKLLTPADNRTWSVTAQMQADPAEAEAFLKALAPPPEPPPDIDEIQKLWVDVALGHEHAAKQAGQLAVKHVGFLLGEVHRLQAMLPAWSTTAPTEPGSYWFYDGTNEPSIAFVFASPILGEGFFVSGTGRRVERFSGQWAGPLVAPTVTP